MIPDETLRHAIEYAAQREYGCPTGELPDAYYDHLRAVVEAALAVAGPAIAADAWDEGYHQGWDDGFTASQVPGSYWDRPNPYHADEIEEQR